MRARTAARRSCATSGASGLQEALLDGPDLGQPARVPLLGGEAGGDERAHEVDRQLLADDPGADAEDVHVVVLDRLVRRVVVVADAGPDTGKLVGGDTDADAT